MLLRQVLVMGLVGLVCGCGGLKLAPVSGRVTLAGKPLVNANVVFQPETEAINPGPGSQGKTDGNGRYLLTVMTGEAKGALIGLHRVSITAYEGDDNSIPSSGGNMVFRKALLPEEFNAKTTLTFEVPAAGAENANFDLVLPSVK